MFKDTSGVSQVTKLLAIGDALNDIASDPRYQKLLPEKQAELSALSDKVNDSLLVDAIDNDQAFARFMYLSDKKKRGQPHDNYGRIPPTEDSGRKRTPENQIAIDEYLKSLRKIGLSKSSQ